MENKYHKNYGVNCRFQWKSMDSNGIFSIGIDSFPMESTTFPMESTIFSIGIENSSGIDIFQWNFNFSSQIDTIPLESTFCHISIGINIFPMESTLFQWNRRFSIGIDIFSNGIDISFQRAVF